MGIGLSSSLLTPGSPNSGIGRPQRPAPVPQVSDSTKEPKPLTPIKVTNEPVLQLPPTIDVADPSPRTAPVSLPPVLQTEITTKNMRTGSLVNLRA